MSTSTKSLPTRQPTSAEKEIIDEVLSLYQCKPSEKAYSHYSETAVFSDPVSIAKGKKSIMSQFNGMPKLFAQSDTIKCDVLDDKSSNDLKLDLTQHYVFKAGKKEKTMNSLLTFKMQNGLIEHHEEEWDHKPNTTGDDGFFGSINEFRKKLSAKVIDATVTSDPNKV